MGHIIATCYNRAVVLLTFPEKGICETYFPIRGAPPLKPHSNIICLCLIPGHFLHVLLKEDCLLPPPCKEWMNHKIGEAEIWHFEFMDRQAPSMTSCLRSRSRQRNQQMSTILLCVTLRLQKNQSKISKSWMKMLIMHYH